MSQETFLLQCYNRSCGKKFDPSDNKDAELAALIQNLSFLFQCGEKVINSELVQSVQLKRTDDCCHHPGHPVFHDAYKRWSCCNKKCIDFTEFLNIKGCTKSSHTHEKPLEPEKPHVDKCKIDKVVKITPKPLNNGLSLQRPPFDAHQLTLSPTISPTLLEQIKELVTLKVKEPTERKIEVGQNCTNNSCKETYTGTTCDEDICNFHPGVPIFHEGLKFWSCCQKRTTDFAAFLEQRGCTQGEHVWFSEDIGKKAQCRMDWHQTGTYVVVSVYAKKYLPSQSTIKLNSIHLTVDLYLIEENSRYNLDIELKGIVDIEQSSVNMLPTKVEIKLKKAELGSWSTLDIARGPKLQTTENKEDIMNVKSQIEAINLDDL